MELKARLLKENGKIVAEEPPASISFEQGSVWGATPRTAKKRVIYRLSSHDSETRTVASTSLASDWKNLSIVGCILAVLVASLCWWISIDLKTLLITHNASVWSWIATVNGYTDFQIAQVLIGLSEGLAVFLVIIVVLEALVVMYVRSKVDSFAKDTLNSIG